MEDLHTVEVIPTQKDLQQLVSLNLSLVTESDEIRLSRLEQRALELGIDLNWDLDNWIRSFGRDYLYRPELLNNAPLTYLCALLICVINEDKWLKQAHPEFVHRLIDRFNRFTLQ